MLTILLKILSIVGMVLLVLLGIVLVAILLILFLPVTYRLEAERYPAERSEGEAPEQEKAFQTKIKLKVNWLFGLLRVRFYYPEPGALKVKLLWKSLVDPSEEKVEPDGKKARAGKREKPDKNAACTGEKEAAKDNPPPEAAGEGDASEKSPESAENTQEKQKEGFLKKIKCTIRRICDKIKKIAKDISFYREQLLCDDTRGLVDHVFRRLGKILKSICPRRLRADVRFGTGSPDTTGYALGVYGMLSPRLGRKINVEPDFTERVLEGRVFAAGHIAAAHFLRHGVMILLDKRLRQLIRKFRSKDTSE